MTKEKLLIKMNCASCANSIEKTLKKINVISKSNPVMGFVIVEYNEKEITINEIIKKIKSIGYEAARE